MRHHISRGIDISKKRGIWMSNFARLRTCRMKQAPILQKKWSPCSSKDSARLVTNIEQAMEKYPKDFNRWDAHMQQLRGSCFSIGASKMNNECTSFRNSCGEENAEGCRRTFQKVKREHAIVRQKLESYFQLLRQAGPARTATRTGGN